MCVCVCAFMCVWERGRVSQYPFSLYPQSMEEADAKIRQLEQEVAQGKQRLEELSAHLSATQGELEVVRCKCKIAEDEAHTIRERAQIHFGTDVATYMTEITHLRKMVGRLSKQVQEQNQQIADQNDELNKVKSDPEMVTARDRVVEQLKDENERLRQDIEEADIKMKSLKSDKDVVDEVSCSGCCMNNKGLFYVRIPARNGLKTLLAFQPESSGLLQGKSCDEIVQCVLLCMR